MNLAEQTVVTKLRYIISDIGVKSKESWWKIRHLFLYEAEHLFTGVDLRWNLLSETITMGQ
jgi:hypothetical protein